MSKIFNFKTLVSFSAFTIASCAAFFSVTGIGALFAGAFIPVLVMAAALEFGKLVGVSFLYRHWKEIPRLLKTYMLFATLTLMIITSAGIYGYLTSAYQKTADKLGVLDTQTQVITLKKDRYTEQLNLYVAERQRLSEGIQELSKGLANNVVQYKDPETGNIITSTSSATRNALQQQLNASINERNNLATKIEQLTDSISSLEMQSLELVANNEVAGEIGPLRYLSNLTGWGMDKVVNIFILIIVVVFDPLSICLVLAYNFLQKKGQVIEEPKKLAIFNEKPITEPEPATEDVKQEEIIVPEPIVQKETMIKRNEIELDPFDPYPQYMTKAETEEVLETWWAKRNGVIR